MKRRKLQQVADALLHVPYHKVQIHVHNRVLIPPREAVGSWVGRALVELLPTGFLTQAARQDTGHS